MQEILTPPADAESAKKKNRRAIMSTPHRPNSLVITHAFPECTIKHCARNIEDHILVACEPF
jgi:hypothetical protein